MLIDKDPFNCFMPYEPVPVANASNGPLMGLTLAVKDIFDVAGYRTGSGCPMRLAQSPVANVTAPAAQRLLNAGAQFVGKTHTDELAWSMYGMNAHFGTPVNPAAPDRIPGGSSSGSAVAVAGGLADIAIGTDKGGSVRAPASFCEIWGMRPTHGRVSLDRVQPLAPSYDTVGLFARDGVTLAAAERLTEAQIANAREARATYAAKIVALLGDTGVLLAPVVPEAPFRLDAPVEVFDRYRHDAMRLLCVASLAGLPQATFPAGIVDGAPYGLSLIGPRGSDLSLIALANALTKGAIA